MRPAGRPQRVVVLELFGGTLLIAVAAVLIDSPVVMEGENLTETEAYISCRVIFRILNFAAPPRVQRREVVLELIFDNLC